MNSFVHDHRFVTDQYRDKYHLITQNNKNFYQFIDKETNPGTNFL